MMEAGSVYYTVLVYLVVKELNLSASPKFVTNDLLTDYSVLNASTNAVIQVESWFVT